MEGLISIYGTDNVLYCPLLSKKTFFSVQYYSSHFNHTLPAQNLN